VTGAEQTGQASGAGPGRRRVAGGLSPAGLSQGGGTAGTAATERVTKVCTSGASGAGGGAAAAATETRRTVVPALITSPSWRSALATLRPLTQVPFLLPMSVSRHRGGLASTMKWSREKYSSFAGS
jgi:hypothetical protein